MQKNIINVVTKIYKFFLAGLYFWLYLLRGFVVYGLYSATCSLFVAVDELFKDLEDRFVSTIYREAAAKYNKYKLESFLSILYFSILSIAIYFVYDIPGSVASVLLFVLLYLVLLGIVLITYTSYYLAYEETVFKYALALAFINSFKRPIVSIAIFLTSFICAYIAYVNLVVLIFIAPPLFGLVAKILLIKKDDSEK